MPFLLFDENKGIGNVGIYSAGVLSNYQLDEQGYKIPVEFERYNGGLILKDSNGDGFLDPTIDIIIGGITNEVPEGATGYQAVTPLVGEKPFCQSQQVILIKGQGKT